MSSIKKGVLFGIFVLLSVLMLSGCGTAGTETGKAKESIVSYIPEFVTLSSHSAFHSPIFKDGSLYYVGIDYDRLNQQEESSIYILPEEESTPAKLPLTLTAKEYIRGMTSNSAGNLLLICEKSDETDSQDTFSSLLIEVDMDGKIISASDITSYLQRPGDQSVILMETDKDGNIYLNESASNQIVVLTSSGEFFFMIDISQPVSAMCRSKNGNVIVGYPAVPGIEIAEIQPEKRNLDGIQKLETTGYSVTLSTGINSDLLAIAGDSIYEYDLQTQTKSLITDCTGNNITGDSVYTIILLEDGRLLLVSSVFWGGDKRPQLCFLKEAEEGEVLPDKKVLKVVSIGFDADVERIASEYNKISQDCRIEVKRCETQEELTRINAELVSGTGPDIIYFPIQQRSESEEEESFLQLPLEQYIRCGILEDLYPYIDADNEIERTDFVENVLRAFEVDEKLYYIPLYFSVDTIIGKTSVLGSKVKWSLDEMIAFAKEQPENTEVFPALSKQDMLNLCLKGNRAQLFTEVNDKISLNTDILLKSLQFADTFDYDQETGGNSRIHAAEQSLTGQLLNQNPNFHYLYGTIQGETQFYCQKEGEPVTFIGYPTEGDQGSYITSSQVTFAINSNSQYKDEAWEFLRNFLKEDYMPWSGWRTFPIRKDGLELILAYAGELAEEVADPDVKVNTMAEIQQVRELIAGLQEIGVEVNQPYMEIIREEAEPFFSGSKTAQEVIAIMENRINLYLREQE